ncbi:MAG: HNH endonuclease [Nitrososphaerota archaeon]|nr:HNH endonuclease [Nitrososphaerota archaeon]
MVEYKAKDHSVLQSELAELATRWPDMRFMRLYDLLWEREWLEAALDAVLDNKGSITAGVDEVSLRNLLDESGEKRTKFLDELQRELQTRNYHPLPVRRKYIPKRKKGELRPIGIPTLKDRVVQMLGKDADGDDPATKIAEISHVLIGWSGYYYRVNASKQFRALDYYARQLFLQWYCRSRKVGIRKALATVIFNGNIAIRRKGTKPLYRTSDRPSEHTALNNKAVWKYRHIENPYLVGNARINAKTEPDDPMREAEAVRSIHPIDKAYGEYYLKSRAKAMLRDGYRCQKCGSNEQLATHHIKHVPRKGRFDAKVVHSVDNLQTLCMNCHIDAHRTG